MSEKSELRKYIEGAVDADCQRNSGQIVTGDYREPKGYGAGIEEGALKLLAVLEEYLSHYRAIEHDPRYEMLVVARKFCGKPTPGGSKE